MYQKSPGLEVQNELLFTEYCQAVRNSDAAATLFRTLSMSMSVFKSTSNS
jgi:hypothetical protein